MAKDTITLSLDGHVTVADFHTAWNAFVGLLDTLTEETNPEAGVNWYIADLKGGSAAVAVRGEFEAVDDAVTVETVVHRFDEVGEAIEHGVLARLSPPVQQFATMLTSVLGGRVPRLKIVGENTWVREQRIEPPAPKLAGPEIRRGTERTSIKGRIVVLSSRQGLYFTLEEAFTKRIVRCYPGPGNKAPLADYWNRGAWVLVEGTFNYITALPTMTSITAIVPFDDASPGGWREARGIAPRLPTDTGDSAARAIRKARDGD